MIRSSVVKAFLARERDSFVWMKSLPEEDLDAMLAELRPKFSITRPDIKLAKQQKVGLLIASAYPFFAYWVDMGGGKSRIALEIIRRRWLQNKIRRALIMAKSDLTAREWVDEITKWQIDISYIVLGNSSSAEKRGALAEFGNGIIIATYGGLTALLSRERSIVEKARLKKARKKNTRVPDKAAIDAFAENIDIAIWDESTRAANKESLTFKVLWHFAEHVPSSYALAGRPFGRDPEMTFGQMLLTDKGESLGENLGVFRQAFFEEKVNFWGGYEYKMTKQGEAKMARALEHRSLSYSPEECGFNVPCIKRVIPLAMPKANQAYLDAVIKELKAAQGNWEATKNAFLRMRQISSGFIGVSDDETGEKAKLDLPENPKLDWTVGRIDEVPLDCKWLIFHEFIYSGQKLHDAIAKLGIKHEWIYGKSENNGAAIRRFKDDPNVKGLITNKVGFYSLNAQIANYVTFFESPPGAIDREQAERRAWRTGQKKVVYMDDPVVEGTADESILAFHKEGDDLMLSLVRNPQAALAKRLKTR